MLINAYTRFGMVEGLGDEEIPYYLAPYVRDFAALAKSFAVSEGRNTAEVDQALASLTQRLAQTAAVAHVAATHASGNTPRKIRNSPTNPFSPGSPSDENNAMPISPANTGAGFRNPPKSSIPRSPPLRN